MEGGRWWRPETGREARPAVGENGAVGWPTLPTGGGARMERWGRHVVQRDDGGFALVASAGEGTGGSGGSPDRLEWSGSGHR